MLRKLNNVLAVEFTCASTIDVDDIVEISAASTVAVPSSAASIAIVGRVCKHAEDATTCTVETKFREYRDDVIAGEAISAGTPIVNSATAPKVIAYTDVSHDSAEIMGLAVTASSQDGDAITALLY